MSLKILMLGEAWSCRTREHRECLRGSEASGKKLSHAWSLEKPSISVGGKAKGRGCPAPWCVPFMAFPVNCP